MLPYIERNYNITYAHVSILFVATFLGYVVAAAGAGTLSRRVGYGHAMLISILVELAGVRPTSRHNPADAHVCLHTTERHQQLSTDELRSYVLRLLRHRYRIRNTGGFHKFRVCYTSLKSVRDVQLGLCNAYFTILKKPLMWTGVLHGVYGLGAFASPLVATAMVTRGVPVRPPRTCARSSTQYADSLQYHFFYTTNVAMNIPVFALAWLAFRNLHALPEHPTERHAAEGASTGGVLRATLRSRAVWTLAIFLMLYVGAEESM